MNKMPEATFMFNWDGIDELLRENNQIAAIRKFREVTGTDLHGAVAAIKQRRVKLGLAKVIEVRVDDAKEKITLDGPDGFRFILVSELYELLK